MQSWAESDGVVKSDHKRVRVSSPFLIDVPKKYVDPHMRLK